MFSELQNCGAALQVEAHPSEMQSTSLKVPAVEKQAHLVICSSTTEIQDQRICFQYNAHACSVTAISNLSTSQVHPAYCLYKV